jgi:hypothetical protein
MRNQVFRTLGVVAGLCLLVSGGPAAAVEPEEGGQLLLNSEFMVMDSFGTDLNVFDLKIEVNDCCGNTGNIARTRGTDLEHDEDFGWRGDLQYKDGAWGLGISGFHFDTEGSESTFVRDDLIPDVNDNEISLRTAHGGCDTRDNDVNCLASVDSDIKMWMVDLYGIRELVSTPDVNLDLQFGLRLAHYEWDVDLFTAPVLDPVGGVFPIGTSGGDNPVRSSSSSEPEDDALVGPFMALFSSGRYGRFRVDGQLSQALVFGELDQGVTSLQYWSGSTDPTATTANLTLEDTNIKRQNQDAVIPITDVRIKLGYDILDSLTLGFGAYATTWFNVPEVPNAESADFQIGNSRLESDEENITLLGASFSLEYRFGGGSMPDLGALNPF